MSTLSSASTNAQVWAAYDDNASYEEDASRSKALAFITACRFILRRRPASTGRGEQSVSFESIKDEMQTARDWLAANPGTEGRSQVRHGSFSDFRD
jgi:hypothetical protein